MRELDALVGSYVHLDKMPRAQEALRELQRIASLVKPIMRNRGWHVGTLTEFWPDQNNLLGLNVNRGQKICLRLRYAGDRTQFMPLDNCVDTMLHELCHNEIGPHNDAFHALWNQLRDEYTDLKIKGYTGEGFLSDGHRLGGARIPQHEMRRQRRIAAERRSVLQKGSGQKLGGRPVPRSVDIRNVITDAVTRRQSILEGCGSGNRDRDERLANEATRNGFRTQAEEDQANDRAIAEALWELAQQDEANREPQDPQQWKSEGLHWDKQKGLDLAAPPPPPQKRHHSAMDSQSSSSTWFEDRDSRADTDMDIDVPVAPNPTPRRNVNPGVPRPDSDVLGIDMFPNSQASRHRPNSSSRTRPKVFTSEKPLPRKPPPIQEHPAFRESVTSNHSSDHSATPSVSSVNSSNPANSPHPSVFMSPIEHNTRRHSVAAPTPLQTSLNNSPSPPPIQIDTTWTCPTCTLVNKADYLCCDACTAPRPCLGTIDDFSSISDLGPHVLPTESPMSPAELQGSDPFSRRSAAPSSASSTRTARPASMYSGSRPQSTKLLTPAQKTARSLEAATRNAVSVQQKRIGWQCPSCRSFMEDVWWCCSACGAMKTTS